MHARSRSEVVEADVDPTGAFAENHNEAHQNPTRIFTNPLLGYGMGFAPRDLIPDASLWN